MFGIGLAEAVVIALVAVFVFGPEKVPELAKQAGQMLRRLRTLATSARDDLRRELGPEYADLELRDLDPREIVRKHVIDAMNEPDEPAPSLKKRHADALAPGEVPPYDLEAT
ncbi:sec-independent translocase [Nocardioides sp. CFH 31398]|uniref:sec-independent translocase n=1 Tax=Nocardioides sp. CFH 31398 TaxID=2919579 RepID=UPI001F06FD73|nr:sec-independent translocase [Nocardioides sp. CFH 31398]MCH1866463.1 sec-independent translocase [Nocardioides sp. CFH 31398]